MIEPGAPATLDVVRAHGPSLVVLALAVVALAPAAGCSLDREAIAGAPNTGGDGELDAARADAGSASDGGAAELDAALDGSPDAGSSGDDDAGLDAGQDGGADGGPTCADDETRCDGRDDDCDGLVDEGTGDCGCDRVLGARGHSYLFCTTTRTFDEARAFCVERGYDLVVIDDADENRFVREEQRTRGNDFLIGLEDRETERTFVWVDGRIAWRDGASILFTSWGGGQPDDFFGEDCVQMRASGDWNDVDCDDRFRHVCESPSP